MRQKRLLKKKVCVQDYPLTCLTHGLESKSHSKRFTGRYSHIAKAQEGSRVTIAILADWIELESCSSHLVDCCIYLFGCLFVFLYGMTAWTKLPRVAWSCWINISEESKMTSAFYFSHTCHVFFHISWYYSPRIAKCTWGPMQQQCDLWYWTSHLRPWLCTLNIVWPRCELENWNQAQILPLVPQQQYVLAQVI